jgi:hypothetical protein
MHLVAYIQVPSFSQIPLFNWNEVPGDHDMETIRIIAHEFGIDFSVDSKIENPNDSVIRISDKNHSTMIRINSKKLTAKLTSDDGASHMLALEKLGDEWIVNKSGTFIQEIVLPVTSYRIQHSILNLAFSIIMGVRMEGSEDDFIEARAAIDMDDFKLLLRDPKALQLLDETHKIFLERYKSFEKLKATDST